MTGDALIIGSVLASGSMLAGVYYLEFRLKKKIKRMNEIVYKCRQSINNGVYDNAIEYGKEVVDTFPKEPNAYYCLGMAYFRAGNTQLALENLKKAENLADRLLNKVNLISIPVDKMKFYIDYADVLNVAGQLDDAIEYYEKALNKAWQQSKREEIARILQKIAGTYEEKGDIDNAIGYYKESLIYAKDNKDRLLIYEKLYTAYKKIGDNDNADLYLRKSFEEEESDTKYLTNK